MFGTIRGPELTPRKIEGETAAMRELEGCYYSYLNLAEWSEYMAQDTADTIRYNERVRQWPILQEELLACVRVQTLGAIEFRHAMITVRRAMDVVRPLGEDYKTTEAACDFADHMDDHVDLIDGRINEQQQFMLRLWERLEATAPPASPARLLN